VPEYSATTTSKTCQPSPKGLGWAGLEKLTNKGKQVNKKAPTRRQFDLFA